MFKDNSPWQDDTGLVIFNEHPKTFKARGIVLEPVIKKIPCLCGAELTD
jgi:hypothetical protein